jgi:hypothetical protein
VVLLVLEDALRGVLHRVLENAIRDVQPHVRVGVEPIVLMSAGLALEDVEVLVLLGVRDVLALVIQPALGNVLLGVVILV